MKFSRIAIAITLLMLISAAALFLFFFERHTEEIDLGFGPEAQRNPFLAAEQFLSRTGIAHRRADNISVIATLAPGDTLFLASSSLIYNAARLRELLDWVDQGGNAIVVANIGDDERDQLLDWLELEITDGHTDLFFNKQVREVFGEEVARSQGQSLSEILRERNRKLSEENGETTQVDNSSGAETPAKNEPESQTADKSRNPDIDPERLTNLTSDGGTSYALYFNPDRVFTHELMGQATETDIDGQLLHWVPLQNASGYSPLVHYEYGHGRITLMTDGGLWRNDRIGTFDHAYFLTHLMGDNRGGETRALVMITRPHFDGLGTLLHRYALELLLAGGLALLAWIGNRSRRFGPLVAGPAPERRSLLEHIRACGHFYWRQDHGQKLFERARRPLLNKVSGHIPGTAQQLTGQKQRAIAESIAARTGLASNEIFTTLWGAAPRNEEDFTARLRSIQIIEAAL